MKDLPTIPRWKGLTSLLLLLLLAFPVAAAADAVREQYFMAENAYQKMLDTPSQRKYRHHWLRVIKGFQAVYDRDPDGAWAAAGLYRTGLTYIELYRRSGRDADRDAGLARLDQVRREFPRSAYRAKAEDQLKAFADVKIPPQSPPAPRKTDTKPAVHRKFESAENCQTRLEQNPRRTKHRDVWLKCIDQYREVYEAEPSGAVAAASLFKMGSLYQQLATYSKNRTDREAGETYLRRLIERYPGSPYSHGQSASGGAACVRCRRQRFRGRRDPTHQCR